jgi:hypothetical protein
MKLPVAKMKSLAGRNEIAGWKGMKSPIVEMKSLAGKE